MVRDIKVCEQCACEYVVENEKKAPTAIVFVVTVAALLSIMLAANMVYISTLDSASLLVSDICGALEGTDPALMILPGPPLFVCNMGMRSLLQKRKDQVPSDDPNLETVNDASPYRHYVYVGGRRSIYRIKSPNLMTAEGSAVFPTIFLVAFAYLLFVERSLILVSGLLLVLWRVLSVRMPLDWTIYGAVVIYVYARMFWRLFLVMERYCMYAVNRYDLERSRYRRC